MAKFLLVSALFLSLAYNFSVAQANRRLVADNEKFTASYRNVLDAEAALATTRLRLDTAEKLLASYKQASRKTAQKGPWWLEPVQVQ